ncbi:MAG: GNAT family N-acetyltransferase [Actinomycetes bacterium]
MADLTTPTTLRDGDLLLRPWAADDAGAVFEACQDPEIQRWTLVPVPYTVDDARGYVSGRDELWEQGRPSFAAVDAETGQLLGSFAVVGADDEAGPEIGYWVVPSARGRGVATRACKALCRWLFDQGVPRIAWRAEVGNVASRRVAEAVGFVVEGTLRQGLVQRGTRVDGWLGSLLPADLARAEAGAPRERTVLPGWPAEHVELRTDRLLIRAYRDSDAPALLAYSNDPVVRSWDPEGLVDLDDARARITYWSKWSSGKGAVWAIADPTDDRTVGGVMLHSIDPHNAAAEVGYGLSPSARGRGLATEAVNAVSDWAFTTLSLQRIRLLHVVENVASCHVAQRCRFVLEGTTRSSYRLGDGELHDEHVHARLATD